MGKGGGGQNELIDRQLQQQEAENHMKLKQLTDTRLQIEKSQGLPSYNSSRPIKR